MVVRTLSTRKISGSPLKKLELKRYHTLTLTSHSAHARAGVWEREREREGWSGAAPVVAGGRGKSSTMP